MTNPKYSGRMTCVEHKRDKDEHGNPITDWSTVPAKLHPAIRQMAVLNVQWTDCPVEVEDDVRRLWTDNELKNNETYYWDRDEAEEDIPNSERYPVLDEYLRDHGYDEITINWWW